MTTPVNNNPQWVLLVRNFSLARMQPYLIETSGDQKRAVELFEWNLTASTQVWPLIVHAEIAFKNAIAKQMDIYAKRKNYTHHWTMDEFGILGSKNYQPDKTLFAEILNAKNRLKSRNKNFSVDDVIAELQFGFWHNLISKRFKNLWPDLVSGFPNYPYRDSTNIFEPVKDIKLLRNRIAHHEKIWNLNFEYYATAILDLINYIDWDMGTYVEPIANQIKTMTKP